MNSGQFITTINKREREVPPDKNEVHPLQFGSEGIFIII